MANIDSVKLPNGNEYNLQDVVSAKGSQPNLLINGWFTVNQRGASTYTANTYTVDRWQKGTNGQFDVVSDGLKITLTSNCYLSELFEDDLKNYLVGKTVTVSLAVVSVSGSITIDISDGNTRQTIPSSNKLTFTVQSGFTGVNFRFQGSGYIIIRAVKLEIGSTSTLHRDTAPDYSTEILKCKRYFRRYKLVNQYNTLGICYILDSTCAFIYPKESIPMRAVPTVSSSGNFAVNIAGTNYNVSAIAIGSPSDEDCIGLQFTSSGMTGGMNGALVAMTAGAYIDLSAEL